MLAFAAAIEPLRAANRVFDEKTFNWKLFSCDGEPLRASKGIEIAFYFIWAGILALPVLASARLIAVNDDRAAATLAYGLNNISPVGALVSLPIEAYSVSS